MGYGCQEVGFHLVQGLKLSVSLGKFISGMSDFFLQKITAFRESLSHKVESMTKFFKFISGGQVNTGLELALAYFTGHTLQLFQWRYHYTAEQKKQNKDGQQDENNSRGGQFQMISSKRSLYFIDRQKYTQASAHFLS